MLFLSLSLSSPAPEGTGISLITIRRGGENGGRETERWRKRCRFMSAFTSSVSLTACVYAVHDIIARCVMSVHEG